MKEWFTSDTHYGHHNVIRYSNRPFNNAEEMDEAMIKGWNSKVSPSDTVYHLGDFFFCGEDRAVSILNRLNGKKILIMGNHDKQVKRSERIREKLTKVCDYLELHINKQKIVMSHYPMITWNASHYGSWMLHGHSHHSMRYPFVGRILDVGVDGEGYNFSPISFQDIKQKMDKVTKVESFDHHIE